MADLNFPNTPVDGQEYEGYIYDGVSGVWIYIAPSIAANNETLRLTAAYDTANAAFDKANAANVLAYNTGIGANAYSMTVGTAGNAYTQTVGTAGNAYTQTVGTAGNAYTQTVGAAGNTYTQTVGAAANNWANTKLSNSTGTFAGTLTISGDLITQGNVILGDASTDTITLNGSTISLGNNQNIDSGTLFVDALNNRVGIGTINPTSHLEIGRNSTNSLEGITLYNNSGAGWGSSIKFDTSWPNRQTTSRIFSENSSANNGRISFLTLLDGNLGTRLTIGPGGGLSSVVETGSSEAGLSISLPNQSPYALRVINRTYNSNPVFSYYAENTGEFRQGTDLATPFSIYTNGYINRRMTIDATGNVGIGTTTPTSNLHVIGTANITSNLIVDDINVVPTISAAFDKANSANLLAYNIGIGSNAWTNTVFGYSNTYTQTVGAAANGWANTISATRSTASNTYADTVGTAGNTYTNTVGSAGNTYTRTVGAAANGWANTVASASSDAANTLSLTRATAANAWTNTVFGYSNTYTQTVGSASNSYATSVGTAGNNYTITVGAASNNWANTVASASAVASNTLSEIRTNAANGWSNTVASASAVAANAYAQSVGNAGNTYTRTVGAASNNWANTVASASAVASNAYTITVGAAANSYANATFVKLVDGNQTITGNLAISGSLSVAGNSYVVDTETLRVSDPLIYLAGNNYTSDMVDIGFVANYVNTTGSNVHTGFFRDYITKEYYIFEGYDEEPDPNHIDTSGNNFTISTLNANLKTNNLLLNGTNATIWIAGSYDKANAANLLAYNIGIGSNAWTNTVFGYSNTYTQTVGSAANGVASASAVAANTYARTVGDAGNTYTRTVGAASNGWANTVASASAVAANAYADTVGTAGNTYTRTVGAASNNWANTVASASAVASNAYTITVGAAANGWANTVASASAVAANTYAATVGSAANGVASVSAVAANTLSLTRASASNGWTNTVFGYSNTFTIAAFTQANTARDHANAAFEKANTSGGGSISAFKANVGNNSANTFNVTHSLNTTDVITTMREWSSGYIVYPDIKVTTANNIVIEFVSAPTSNQYRLIVVGA